MHIVNLIDDKGKGWKTRRSKRRKEGGKEGEGRTRRRKEKKKEGGSKRKLVHGNSPLFCESLLMRTAVTQRAKLL